jgi:two-component system KDP operon response regulator KdpE
LIEDDPQIRKFLRAALNAADYRLYEAATGEDGLAQAAARRPDLVLLDLGLPDKDGVEVLKQIRKWSQMPVVVLSARDREKDKIEALDAGADDYVSKPFAAGELLARIRASLRRAARVDKDNVSGVVTFGNITVNLGSRRVFTGEEEVHLTPNEYKLLQVLVRHAGKVVTHCQLLNEVWGPQHIEEAQYLRVYMAQLRRKLEPDPGRPKHFITEAGIGDRLLIE